MILRLTILISLITTILVGCTSIQPLNPVEAQNQLQAIWQADKHMVWELDWPVVPLGGSVTIESWQADDRYRFEILESPAPALRGETLVFNGQTAWQYNRLTPPAEFTPATAQLSPITEALAIIEQLLAQTPQTARQETAQINFNPAHKITVTYPNGDSLALWQNTETGLLSRLVFVVNDQQGKLNIRYTEPLSKPSAKLFEVGWLLGD